MPPDHYRRVAIRLIKNIQRNNECWEWTGYVDKRGYGQSFVFTRGKSHTVTAHRLSYKVFRGELPDDLVLDHLCRNTKCINPEHLDPVTIKENTNRGVGAWATRARKTHCKRGHEFTKENTRILKGKGNARLCRTCAILANREYRRRLKEKRDA